MIKSFAAATDRASTPSPMSKYVGGALGGAIATAPMTLAMAAINQLLATDERLPLPQEPELIVRELLRRSGLGAHIDDANQHRLSWCAHIAYGSGCGAVFAGFASAKRQRSPAEAAGFGLLIWALSYCGWLPSLGILPPPPRRPLGRNVLLVASHLVWGTALGIALEQLIGNRQEPGNDGSARLPVRG